MDRKKATDIYDSFIDHLLENGWNGKRYAYTETVREEPATEEFWAHLKLINGFNLKLCCEVNEGDDDVSLQYWFDDDSEKRFNVDSIEQLLWLA